MLRVCASEGLRPWEVYAMTPREVEVFLQGREEHWARIRALMAWMQANLMNAHGGKRKVKPEGLLPKEDVRKQRQGRKKEEPKSLLGMTPTEVTGLFTEKRISKAEAAYWRSPEGLRVKALQKVLGYEDEEAED